MQKLSITLLSAALLAGCATLEDAPTASETAAFDYASVFSQDDRPAADYDDYEVRKAQAVLTFTGLQPGMTVVELEAGTGFYTELFSKVVGDSGRVFMQNPAQFDTFIGDGLEPRLGNNRLPNVSYVKAPFDGEITEDGSADMVTWFLGPHELWWTPDDEEPGVFGTPETVFARIADMLKPGGVFVALDHSAPDGAPSSTGGDTHRIDESIIRELAEKHGMTLVAESDVLRNADDDRTVMVFDPAIRRKTDRFLLKFEKN